MGQQQLLLLVLGIVIVGLAVVVGIQAFGENQTKANTDAVVNDAIRVASDAQSWALKPSAFGGGDGGFTGVTLQKLGFGADSTASINGTSRTGYINANGGYVLSGAAQNALTITGHGKSGSTVVVTLKGTGSDDISTAVTNPN